MKIFVLFALSFLLGINYLYAVQDTDGTYFVTSFPCYNELNKGNMGVSLHFASNVNTVNKATITYWSYISNIMMVKTVWMDSLGFSDTNLIYSDVVKDNVDLSKEHTLMWDPRIIITSQYSMKVISRIYNQVSGYGDAEMIPSSTIAHQNYLVQMPKPNPGAVQLIHVYGTDTKDVSVSVFHYVNGNYYSDYVLKVPRYLGSYQNVISVPADDNSHSFSIYGDSAIFVVGAVTKVDLISTNSIGQSTFNSIFDYAYMHFYPSHYYDCTYALNGDGDRRMITSQYTKTVYITPPRFNGCENKIPITVFNQYNANKPAQASLKQYTASPMILKSGAQQGTNSHYSYTPWIRFGGQRGNLEATQEQLFTAFIHYVPETSQFITGDLTFLTFTPNSVLEIYAESSILANTFYIDNMLVTNTLMTSSSSINFFNGKYARYTIKVSNLGFHVLSIKSQGSYIVYVIGQNIKGITGTYGYVAGYNVNKLGTYKTGFETTTKSASAVGGSLLIMFSFCIRLML